MQVPMVVVGVEALASMGNSSHLNSIRISARAMCKMWAIKQ